MHPNTYLKTFWRMDLRPDVFVAMSFDERYEARFNDVIKPAVEAISIGNRPLRAHRVDLSKSGDSILTDIMDGIAHAQLVLADVSTVGSDKTTGYPYRNGNVMYEVGLALACRQPSEVLLVRDDGDRFLFDVSTIPHRKVDFTDAAGARQILTDALLERFRERQLIHDARVQITMSGLSAEEMKLLAQVKTHGPEKSWGFKDDNTINFLAMAAIPRLLDKQIIVLRGRFPEGHPAYGWTPLGYEVVRRISGLRVFEMDVKFVGSESPMPPVTDGAPAPSVGPEQPT